MVTEDEVITHQTEYRNDDTLQEGVTKVFQEGQDGLIHKTFENTTSMMKNALLHW